MSILDQENAPQANLMEAANTLSFLMTLVYVKVTKSNQTITKILNKPSSTLQLMLLSILEKNKYRYAQQCTLSSEVLCQRKKQDAACYTLSDATDMATVEQLNRASEKKLLAGLLLELEIQLEEAR